MSRFELDYTTMLAQQVKDEIDFLVRHGHDREKIYIKCMFCERSSDHLEVFYSCSRLKELREFHSRIIQEQRFSQLPFVKNQFT